MRFNILQIPYMTKASEFPEGIRDGELRGANSERFQTMLNAMTEQVQFAEELGYHGVAWTEQHFQAEGVEVNTNPILYGAHMIANTTRMKVGQLGIPLPCHNPLLVAENLAILDHMSGGRTFAGFSRSNTPRYASVLGQHLGIGAASSDKSESDERNRRALQESFQIIKKAWTEDQFCYSGEFWQVPPADVPWEFPPTIDAGRGTKDGVLSQISVVPKPLQSPHPPIYSPFAFSMTTARFWAAEGASLVSFVDKEDFLRTTLDVYRDEATKAEQTIPTGGGLAIGGHLLVQKSRERSNAYATEFERLFNYAYDVPPYNVPLGRKLQGTGDDALRTIEHLNKALGIEEIFLWHHVNCFDDGREMEALEEFGNKVVARLGD
ncbi:LLM class flavin-dependent oxidoreductase [Arthrobacter crystallopoietes]|uniref:LLM class flavin-dependent oxidoreductase n=1 Tax=Crystallibacter crystallopoietes TaxID=37928 RepID=UPI0011115698|nr:LLM class flavin-dependent oxidoreductase [Arthrobacter crystallopoietes]